jgi:hypothetical protein
MSDASTTAAAAAPAFTSRAYANRIAAVKRLSSKTKNGALL